MTPPPFTRMSGITTTPSGDVYYASLAGSHIARIDVESGEATVIEPPTPKQGARRVWSDSKGNLWVSEWNSGNLSRYTPATNTWKMWKLPGDKPKAYAVYVDDQDIVWLSDFGANALVRFEPRTARFTRVSLPTADANVRQIHGRRGEVWGAESATDKLIVGACPYAWPWNVLGWPGVNVPAGLTPDGLPVGVPDPNPKVGRVIFVDETSPHTALTRRRARARTASTSRRARPGRPTMTSHRRRPVRTEGGRRSPRTLGGVAPRRKSRA